MTGAITKSLNLRKYCSQVGIVMQESVLFETAICKSICYGKPGTTDNEIIITAVKMSNAHNFIMKLNDGCNTPWK